jgi:chromate reductase
MSALSEPSFLVLGIAGSLRRASYNRGLVRAAAEVAPPGVIVEAFDLGPMPLYDDDVRERGDPEPVRRLKEHIAAADALLIATPEYNYSIPGVLKNAIDWASRPAATTPLRHKPVALAGATGGGFGTVRAQLALRQVFVYTETHCLLKPELLVSKAGEKFDADGNLTDPHTRDGLRALLVALVDWSRRLRGEKSPPG